ncbi:MAG: hypothetical protein U0575_14860 [Phycisphaerales bacterium]
MLPSPSGIRRIASLFSVALLVLAVRAAAQDVAIELETFGVGNQFRPGDWTAVRFKLTLRNGEPRSVQLVWEVENVDGDIGEHVRTLVLNPGSPSVRWLSAKLGPRVDAATVFTVRVYDDNDGRRGRELAATRISPATAQPPAAEVRIEESMLAVLGRFRMNLDGYSTVYGNLLMPPGMNETTRVVAGLDARDLPDRWEGLSGFEAIVWGDVPPQALELEEAEALREYIRRGGHLVIVLPQAGNPWAIGAPSSHQLHDLLPSVAPRRVESVPIAEIVPILSKVDALRNPRAETNLLVFDPERLDRGWEPLMAVPARRSPVDGRVLAGIGADGRPSPESVAGAIVAVQRRLGFGRISLIGVDVGSFSELQPGGFPQPDAFWNRVLARRGDTPTAGDLKALDTAQPRRLVSGRGTNLFMGGGELIAGQIGMSGEAALGLLAAVAVFALYWLLAGWLSFAMLRKVGYVRHAWLAFVGVSVIFTLVSWAGGSLLRQRSVRIQHVTFLDHIARMPGAPTGDEPQYQRGVSWFSVYLPGYGGGKLALTSETGQRDLLASWIAPPGNVSQRFPNIDRYTVAYGSPNAYRIPSRATATTLEARWLGPVDDTIGRMPYATATVQETLVRGPNASAALGGALRHDLRGPLMDVQVIYISSCRTPLRRMAAASGPSAAEPAVPGEMLNFGRIAGIAEWPPGTDLDLAAAFGFDRQPMPIPDRQPKVSLPMTMRALYVEDLDSSITLGDAITLTVETRARLEQALSVFNMLPPPRWLENQPGKSTLRFQRQLGRELDLSAWFGRPCVMVIGLLREERAVPPMPLTVDGERPPASGVTIVRWVMPLPLAADFVVPDERPAPPTTPAPRPGDATGAGDGSNDAPADEP